MREVLFLDLARSASSLGAEAHTVFANVLASGRFLFGEHGERFERAFAAYCGAAAGVGVASGTDALRLALLACGVTPGDEVITVANSAMATVAAITSIGARPAFVDVDPATWTMDPAQLPSRLTARTRAILPVHLYGQCADMEPILAFARRRGLAVVEDCAHAHGARYHGRVAGTMGDAGCYSFYPTKNLGAFGDAGMVVTNDLTIAERVRALREYGRASHDLTGLHGYNSRLDELQAAILFLKLERLDAANCRRRAIAQTYARALTDMERSLPYEAPGRYHVYHLYVIRVKDRDGFRARLQEQGVQTHVHYPLALHRHEAYQGVRADTFELPVTDRVHSEVVSLPLYPELSDEEIEAVTDAVRQATAVRV